MQFFCQHISVWCVKNSCPLSISPPESFWSASACSITSAKNRLSITSAQPLHLLVKMQTWRSFHNNGIGTVLGGPENMGSSKHLTQTMLSSCIPCRLLTFRRTCRSADTWCTDSESKTTLGATTNSCNMTWKLPIFCKVTQCNSCSRTSGLFFIVMLQLRAYHWPCMASLRISFSVFRVAPCIALWLRFPNRINGLAALLLICFSSSLVCQNLYIKWCFNFGFYTWTLHRVTFQMILPLQLPISSLRY